MNDDQSGRLNKVLRIIGYTISGCVIWFYTTKWLTSLFSVVEESVSVLFIVLGIGWPIIFLILIVNCYALCGWIKTGKKGDIFEDLFGSGE